MVFLFFTGPAKAPLEVFVSFHAAQDIGGTISYFSSILLIMQVLGPDLVDVGILYLKNKIECHI